MVNGSREWVAAFPFGRGNVLGRLSKLGATLFLTEDALRIVPVAGLGRAKTIPLGDVRSVEACGEQPPRLRITTRGGKPLTLLVLDRRMRAIWNSRSDARDDALHHINEAL